MYQIHEHAGTWPPLTLEPYLTYLTMRLKLDAGELITLVLADDAFAQRLNRDHRGKDAPTNVLSYNSDMQGELGDLIFAQETIAREATDLSIPFDHHLMHLILHGSLHLLGYDHENQTDAETMETLETQILTNFGLQDPYQFPSTAPQLEEL